MSPFRRGQAVVAWLSDSSPSFGTAGAVAASGRTISFAMALNPDLLIGNSKGFSLSRAAGTPLIRVGFPIHDRISGPRSLHLGYRGAQRLFDTIVDKCMEIKQESNDIGYMYI